MDFQPQSARIRTNRAEIIGNYDGLAIRSATKATEKLIAAATNLKVIGRAGIGVDNVDIPPLRAVYHCDMNTPFGNSITTAEHAIALMFAVAVSFLPLMHPRRLGSWEKSKFMGVGNHRQDAGCIGAGNIGSIVCSRAIGLKMHVIAFDPFLSGTRPGNGCDQG